jgi:hypothetical protein
MILVAHPDPDPEFLPIPDPRTRDQKGTGSRIRIRNTAKIPSLAPLSTHLYSTTFPLSLSPPAPSTIIVSHPTSGLLSRSTPCSQIHRF